MKNILIPIDFSDISKNAIRYAIGLFQKVPCNFYLVYVNVEGFDHVQKTIPQLGTNILVEKEPISIEKKLKEWKHFSESFSKKSHTFTAIHTIGYFLESIRKLIQEKHLELIIMGTKGASEIKEFFMGSNTGNVITKIDCNVLVVPSNAVFQEFKQIVFPTDLSFVYSNDVLMDLRNLIQSDTAQIRVLHVSKVNTELSKNELSIKSEILQLLKNTFPNPISFHSLVNTNVEQTVLNYSESINAELIVMVSKNYGFLHKQLFDTTVEEVSFDTEIPLLSIQG
ncbi:universal stress protein [Maribacter sp. CXY002]|uniref:universal stress protein n=1 Tax=Maribacter luteocoastalis TaxID=3407671 RepID=UPI003B67B7E8